MADVSYDKEGLEFLLEEMKSMRIRIKDKGKNSRAMKEDILEETFGVSPTGPVAVLLPLPSNNKGCRKRLPWPAEKSYDRN